MTELTRFIRFIVSLLFLLTNLAFSQTVTETSSISIKPIFGAHMLKTPEGSLHDQIYGVDLTYLKNLSNKEDAWIKESRICGYGFMLIMRQLNMIKGPGDTALNSVGQAYGATAVAKFNFIKVNHINLYISPSGGVSYLTKSFFNHPKNRYIGSHVNITLAADLGIEFEVTKNAKLSTGVGVVHYSNSGMIIPNGGLNTAHIFIQLALNKYSSEATSKKFSNYLPLHKNSFEFGAGIGRRGIYEQHKGLFRSGFYIGYNHRLNDAFVLKSGLDAVYYGTRYNPQKNLETFQYYGSSYDNWRTGLSVGADLNLWRLTINVQTGKYLHFNRLYKDINWYWTFGPTFFITPHVGIQAKTYMHRTQADYLNYGMLFKI